MWFTLTLLTVFLGYAAFIKGGVESKDFNWGLLGLGVLAVTAGFGGRKQVASPLERWLCWPLLLLPCTVALQLVPLPVSWLKSLSPARVEVHEAVARMIPEDKLTSLSVFPTDTFQQLLGIAGCVAVFLLVREIGGRAEDRPWVVAFPLLLVAGLEAVLGLVQSALGDNDAVAHGTYVNRNHFSGLLEMVFPFAVIYPVSLLRSERFRQSPSALPALKACAVWAVATVILLGIIYSLSRMGFIASLTSLFVMAALGFGARLSALHSVSNSVVAAADKRNLLGVIYVAMHKNKKWVAVGLVGILILLSFVFLPPDQLIYRFADLSRGEEVSANDRMLMWKETLHLIAAYPIFGCGVGGYESAFLKFSVSSPNSTVDFAHNDYLQSLAELGVVGFLILAGLMLAILVKAVRAASQDSDASGRWLGLACTGSMAAILLHSFVDFNLYIPANALVLAWIGGIAAGGFTNGRRETEGRSQEAEVRRQEAVGRRQEAEVRRQEAVGRRQAP